jgi:hypothetical protein
MIFAEHVLFWGSVPKVPHDSSEAIDTKRHSDEAMDLTRKMGPW